MQQKQEKNQNEEINWERVQAWIQTGIMFLLGLYFIDLALPGGNLGNYINDTNFGWLTWVGAAILLLIAAINTYDLMQPANPNATENLFGHNSRYGGFSSWLFLLVVAVPLIFGLGVPSKPLGAGAITGGVSSDVRSIGFNNAPAATLNLEKTNILDWVRAFAVSSDLDEFEGEAVKDLIGFVYRDARFAGTDNFMLVRFTLSCCVADARPIGLVVDNTEGVQLDQDTWILVNGTITIRNLDGIDTPIIIPNSIEPTQQPEQPYLYF